MVPEHQGAQQGLGWDRPPRLQIEEIGQQRRAMHVLLVQRHPLRLQPAHGNHEGGALRQHRFVGGGGLQWKAGGTVGLDEHGLDAGQVPKYRDPVHGNTVEFARSQHSGTNHR